MHTWSQENCALPDTLRSIVLGTAGLALVAAAALLVMLRRPRVASAHRVLIGVVQVSALAIVMQAGHFAEETVTRFYERFPELLGLAPWPHGFFVAFNIAWLTIWGVSLRGVMVRSRPAVFALWFLALAGIVNGVVHPLLALRVGGYFPGLFTAPLVGLAGVLLARRLAGATGAPEQGDHDGTAEHID